MRRVTAALLVTLSVALPGSAQNPNPRLHRFIPGDLGLGALPAGVLAGPESAESLRAATAGTGWQDDPSRRTSLVRPRDSWEAVARSLDTDTRSPTGARLSYREVFTPSISPFKRVNAYDAVDELGRLVVRDPSLRPVRVGEVPPRWSRTPLARFTGEVQVELSLTAPTPIPSVGAEQALVSFRTEPETPVAFFHDSAGNLFVRADTARTVRLVYVLDAPQSTFVMPGVPSTPVGSIDFHGLAPPPNVPQFLATSAAEVLSRVGVQRHEPYNSLLPRLVEYFRRFRDAELTPQQQRANLYLTLGLGGVGACRHRAYAFVLTLHALGVPARYVGNEAHAWAEVVVPGVGWSRVDLGGWDIALQNDAAGRESFLPDNPDPFPRPPEYENGYSTATASPGRHGRHHRPRPDENPGANAPTEVIDPSATQGELNAGATGTQPTTDALGDPANLNETGAPTTGAGPQALAATPGATANAGTTGARRVAGAVGAQTASPNAPRAQSEGTAAPEGEAPDGNEPPAEEIELHRTTLTLRAVRAPDGNAPRGFVRGTLIVCEGDARDETGASIRDLPVVLELSLASRAQGRGRRDTALGTTVTREDGRFEARVLLPLDLPAGEYSLRVRTSGDARHTPAHSE